MDAIPTPEAPTPEGPTPEARRDSSMRRVGAAKTALVSAALLASLGIAGGLAVQAAEAPSVTAEPVTSQQAESAPDLGENDNSTLIQPPNGQQPQATTQGS